MLMVLEPFSPLMYRFVLRAYIASFALCFIVAYVTEPITKVQVKNEWKWPEKRQWEMEMVRRKPSEMETGQHC